MTNPLADRIRPEKRRLWQPLHGVTHHCKSYIQLLKISHFSFLISTVTVIIISPPAFVFVASTYILAHGGWRGHLPLLFFALCQSLFYTQCVILEEGGEAQAKDAG